MSADLRDLAESRARRLSRLVEIVEACQEMGEHLDVDVIQDVLDELEREMAAAADRMPTKVHELTGEQYTVAILLTVLSAAIADVNEYASQYIPPGRLRRTLLELVDQMRDLVATEFLPRAKPEIRLALMTEAAAWGYSLWSPEQREQLLHLMEVAAQGGYIHAADRDVARDLLKKFQGMRQPGLPEREQAGESA